MLFAAALAAIIDAPWLGALALWIPQMIGVYERRTRVPWRATFSSSRQAAAECGIEAIMIERLPQALRLHHVGMQFRSARHRIDAASEALFVDMYDQIEAELAGAGIAETRSSPGDFQVVSTCNSGNGGFAGWNALSARCSRTDEIFADQIEHHWIFRLGHGLAHDVDALGFQLFEMAEPRSRRPRVSISDGAIGSSAPSTGGK